MAEAIAGSAQHIVKYCGEEQYGYCTGWRKYWWYLGMRHSGLDDNKYLDLSKAIGYRRWMRNRGDAAPSSLYYRHDIADEALNRTNVESCATRSEVNISLCHNSFDLEASFDVIYHRAVSNDLRSL